MDNFDALDRPGGAAPVMRWAFVGLHQSFARAPTPNWSFDRPANPASAAEVAPGTIVHSNEPVPPAPVRRPSEAPLPLIKAGTRAAKRRKRGAKKQAKCLNPQALLGAEAYIRERSRSPQSDILKLRLSRFAGLRAGEIAALPMTALLDPTGQIAETFEVRSLKMRAHSGHREIPVHPSIAEAVRDLLQAYPKAAFVAFTVGKDNVLRRQSAESLANWFFRLYKAVGLNGCSSHSGRRTFATEIARNLPRHNASLRDLQRLLGHKSLTSTECYVDISSSVHSLVRSLGHVG